MVMEREVPEPLGIFRVSDVADTKVTPVAGTLMVPNLTVGGCEVATHEFNDVPVTVTVLPID